MLWSHCRPILALLDSGHREDIKLNVPRLVCTSLLKREVKLIMHMDGYGESGGCTMM